MTTSSNRRWPDGRGRGVALLAAAVLLAVPARAAAAIDHLTGTPDELAGWDALMDDKWIAARELGDKVLRADPASFAGHFILGMALARGEGDLPRAAHQLDLAMKGYEARHAVDDALAGKSGEAGPWRWHQATLRELISALGAMDRPAEQLALIEKHNRLYAPPLQAHRIWPLMKLHRYDESRQAAREAIAANIGGQRKYARADLCGAESEAGDRQRAYEACLEATSEFRDSDDMAGQLEYSNASDSALEVFRFDEAERLILESTRRANTVPWVNPFRQAAELFLTEGRIPEAVDALRGGQQLRIARASWVDQFDRAAFDGTLAKLFLLAGIAERAVAAAERAFAQPDRQGHASGNETQAESASSLVLAVALRDRAERRVEEAVTSDLLPGLKLRVRALYDRLQAWRARRSAAVSLSDEDFLVRSLRPYYLGILLPPWLLPEVVDTVGGGVALSGLAKARAADPHPVAAHYFRAFEAEAQFVRGDLRAADDAAAQALSRLPQAEVLLRARMELIVAECARERGEASAAATHYLRVLQRDPGLLRRSGIALPVAIAGDGSELGDKAARLLGRSPRFARGEGQLSLRVEGAGTRPRVCLLGPSSEQVACASVNLPADVTPEAGARLLVAEAHQALFAVKLDLTQSDLTSLDGSPASGRADRHVQSVLDQLGEPGQERK